MKVTHKQSPSTHTPDGSRRALLQLTCMRRVADPRAALTVAALTMSLMSLSACIEEDAEFHDKQSLTSPVGDQGPVMTCGVDGLCNVAYCDINDDPDCAQIGCEADEVCNKSCLTDPDCARDACQEDGHCDPWCAFDRDCADECRRWTSQPVEVVTTACGETARVIRNPHHPLVMARAFIEDKWPDFDTAQHLDYDENDNGVRDSGETQWRRGHATANLEGFGASLTRGGGGPLWNDVHATDLPHEPSLLFFEATTGAHSSWAVIGAGYHYHFNPCEVPCLKGVPEDDFLIHEAGWHRLGDGGFDCVKERWVDKDGGAPVVDIFDQCVEVNKDDFHRAGLTFGLNKHERVWTVHLFFEPGTNGVALALDDPWCRDHDDPTDPPVVTVDCPEVDGFYPQTQTCECSDAATGHDH